MGIETWKNEFYSKNVAQTRPSRAASHSLKKWSGLLLDNLVEHNVSIMPSLSTLKISDDSSGSVFLFGSGTCALCYHFADSFTNECANCPIKKLGFKICGLKNSIYETACSSKNPQDMIALLKICVKYQNKKGL